MTEAPKPPPGSPEDPRATMLGVGCAYTILLLVALGWLGLRGRWSALAATAIGTHGVLASGAVGLAVGVIGHCMLATVSRRAPAIAELEERAHELLVGMTQAAAFSFVLTAALIEELFFRLAVQDAFGLAGSVAAYVLLSMSAGRSVLLLAAAHALCMGGLVELGFGLYASTTAHAVINYLSLRRMTCR